MFELGINIMAGLVYIVIFMLPVLLIVGCIYAAQQLVGTAFATAVATVMLGCWLALKTMKLTHRIIG